MKRRLRLSRKQRKQVGVGFALAAVALLVMLAIQPNSAPQSAAAAMTTSCRDAVEEEGGLQRLAQGFGEDPLGCLAQAFGLDPAEGETVQVWFSWDGSAWQQTTAALATTEEGYSAESHVSGADTFEIQVKNLDSGERLYTQTLTRDSAFGLLSVSMLNLPGADVVEIIDSNGATYSFEVA